MKRVAARFTGTQRMDVLAARDLPLDIFVHYKADLCRRLSGRGKWLDSSGWRACRWLRSVDPIGVVNVEAG